MNTGERLIARSGLKPFGMLISCLFLFVLVMGRVIDGTVSGAEKDLRDPRDEGAHVLPMWDVIDRKGNIIATDARWLRLSMSPRVFLQGHTPGRIAKGLDGCLDHGLGRRTVLDCMLPDADEGVIQVRRPLGVSATRVLDDWLASGESKRRATPPVSGMWLQSVGTQNEYALFWMPEVLLSAETRAAQGFEGRPSSWCRKIADRLFTPLFGEPLPSDETALVRARRDVWKLLVPDQYEVVFDRLSISEGKQIREFLIDEGISGGQMKLSWYRERTYPAARGSDLKEAGYDWLGPWLFRTQEGCERVVLRRYGFYSLSQDIPEALLATIKKEIREEAARRFPLSRLEAECEAMFQQEEFKSFAAKPAKVAYREFQPAHHSTQLHLLGADDEGETPRVITSINVDLQNFLHHVLSETVAEQDAALAMGIVVMVQTGEVLAIAGVSRYSQAQFLPLQYSFTPGSTFKPIIAAAALDLGVVSPGDMFKTYDRHFPVGTVVPGCRRRPVREARNSNLGTNGELSMRDGVAYSVNAVMVQVGLKMPMEYLHSVLINLGYGEPLQTDLGTTSRGIVRPFEKWDQCYTQASVSFGHELQCNLWQHAAALSTVLRGGEYLPLRVLERVERGRDERSIRPKPGHVVFGYEACQEVRGMMQRAARVGTGKRIFKEISAAGTPITFGLKTGTTEKEPGTSCSHLELACAEQCAEDGVQRDCTAYGRTGTPPHSRNCFVASMMAFGSVGNLEADLPCAGTEGEVMVLIVVDEPRGKNYYGSQVAGPPVMAVLQEALELTTHGRRMEIGPKISFEDHYTEVTEDPVQGFLDRGFGGGR